MLHFVSRLPVDLLADIAQVAHGIRLDEPVEGEFHGGIQDVDHVIAGLAQILIGRSQYLQGSGARGHARSPLSRKEGTGN